jgi:hypothetical protein
MFKIDMPFHLPYTMASCDMTKEYQLTFKKKVVGAIDKIGFA